MCFGAFGGIGMWAGNAESAFKNGSQPTELSIPRVSQRGTVVTADRINGHHHYVSQARRGWREIWGQNRALRKSLAAGANENTTISFSNNVSVEGKPLPAGTVRPAHDPRQGSVDDHFLEEFNFVGQL